MGTRQGHHVRGGPDTEKSTFEKLVFHVKLPARGADGKAEKIVEEAARHSEERVVTRTSGRSASDRAMKTHQSCHRHAIVR